MIQLRKKKHTINIDGKIDKEIERYIRRRAVEIIRGGGPFPSESQLFEELLANGLAFAKAKGKRFEG